MNSQPLNLDAISVRTPCHVAWESMIGSAQVRHCASCKLNVYNLSEMTREEAMRLVAEREGRLCVRFHRRPDGTLLTRDCGPVLATRKRRRTIVSTAAAVLAYAGALAGAWRVSESRFTAANQRTPPPNPA